MLRVEVLTSVAALEALAPEWEALWRVDAQATPFSSPAWLLPWAQSFVDNPPWTLAVRNHAGELVALLPACTYQRQLMLLGAGTSDYGGWLVRAGCEDAALEALQGALRASAPSSTGWDRAQFSQLRAGSALLQLGEPAPAEPCSQVSLGRHALALSSKLRGNISYYRRRAAALGELRWQQADSAEVALAAFEVLVGIHSRRWQAEGEAGVLADPRVLAHHRAALPALHAAGALRVYTLSAGAHTLGVSYALADPPGAARRRLFYYLMGFDPEYTALSPGTLLMAHVLESAEQEGFLAVDLLRGEEPYKRLWGAEVVPTCSVAFARASTQEDR